MQVVIAILGLLGQVALMPARTKLSDVSTGTTARSIAQSDLVPTQHTCAVPEGATAAEVCPGMCVYPCVLSTPLGATVRQVVALAVLLEVHRKVGSFD